MECTIKNGGKNLETIMKNVSPISDAEVRTRRVQRNQAEKLFSKITALDPAQQNPDVRNRPRSLESN